MSNSQKYHHLDEQFIRDTSMETSSLNFMVTLKKYVSIRQGIYIRTQVAPSGGLKWASDPPGNHATSPIVCNARFVDQPCRERQIQLATLDRRGVATLAR